MHTPAMQVLRLDNRYCLCFPSTPRQGGGESIPHIYLTSAVPTMIATRVPRTARRGSLTWQAMTERGAEQRRHAEILLPLSSLLPPGKPRTVSRRGKGSVPCFFHTWYAPSFAEGRNAAISRGFCLETRNAKLLVYTVSGDTIAAVPTTRTADSQRQCEWLERKLDLRASHLT